MFTATLILSWIEVLQQADSVTSLMSLVISLPAAASNTRRKLCQSRGSGEHSEGWEGQCLLAPSLLFLIGFPHQKHKITSQTR